MEYNPDYTKCTYDELLDAYRNINKSKYPERAKIIYDEIQLRKNENRINVSSEDEINKTITAMEPVSTSVISDLRNLMIAGYIILFILVIINFYK